MDLKFKDNSKLRLGYTQLEYIESTGTQCLNLGQKYLENYEIALNITVVEVPSPYRAFIMCNESNSKWAGILIGDRRFYLYRNSGSAIIHSEVYVNANTNYSLRYKIKNNDNFLSVNGTTKTSAFSGYYPTGDLIVANLVKIKIKIINIYNNSTLENNLIPCITDQGTPGMYDTISETFFYSQGTGNFVAGPAVTTILPETILLKTTTLYHKNMPNVGGLQLLNGILNYQKTHQDEVKAYYYSTTQLWQDIITKYPDIIQYYDMDHKLCTPICEADDPEQFTEDLLEIIEDYPDIVDVIEDYPDIVDFITENPTLTPIIVEWNPIIHSLIDTGYENALIGDGNSWIDTGDRINDNTNYEIKFNADNSNNGEIFGNGIINNSLSYALIQLLNNNTYTIIFRYGGGGYNNQKYIANNGNHVFEIRTSNGVGEIIFDNNILATNIQIPQQSYNSYLFGVKQSASNPNTPFAGSIFYYKTTNNANNIIKYLTPFYRNGHYGMIDLITLTFYPNAGSGEFTYSLEPKNA